MCEAEALPRVEIVPYNPQWPSAYAAERADILSIGGPAIVELERIGSTSVPGLSAKPIIDMMAAVTDLEIGQVVAAQLEQHRYRLIEAGMQNRLFLCRPSAVDDCTAFHLHIVEQCTWGERHERLMRDYLFAHSDAVAAYGALKIELARYAQDSLAYTKAKTAFRN